MIKSMKRTLCLLISILLSLFIASSSLAVGNSSDSQNIAPFEGIKDISEEMKELVKKHKKIDDASRSEAENLLYEIGLINSRILNFQNSIEQETNEKITDSINKDINKLLKEKERISKKLEKIGLRKLSREELQVLVEVGNQGIKSGGVITLSDPPVTVPPDTSQIDWWGQSYTYNYNGTTYNMFDLYAQGKAPPTLARTDAPIALGQSSIPTAEIVNSIFQYFAEKAIGAFFPIASWIPVNLYWNPAITPDTLAYSYTVTPTQVVTMKWTYVERYSGTWAMTKASNAANITETQLMVYYKPGSSEHSTTTTSRWVMSSLYSDIPAAITWLTNGYYDLYGTREDRVYSTKYTDANGNTKGTVPIIYYKAPGYLY